MNISASHITYYLLCHRKLWLHHQGMRMEDNSMDVAEGKLIGKSTYLRRSKKWRELALEGIKIDHFDPKELIVREVKKSPKLEHVHIAQVQYYLYRIKQAGVEGATGLIEYPKQRKNTQVLLTEETETEVRRWLADIQTIVNQSTCPELKEKTYCKNCAFRDFCFC